MIQIMETTKRFNDFTAVDNVSLTIPEGDFFALLGPNGAGKTTLIRMLIGLLKPSKGKIIMNGLEMSRNNNELKKQLGIVPQYTNLDKELTVKENLIFSAKLNKLSKTETERRVNELLEFVELKDVEKRETKKLSGGMQRKLMIAKALINNPNILFLDEPTVGIDLNARRKIWDILKTMKNKGKTILLTTHYIEEAEYLCDKVSLMDKGKIFYYDTPENLRNKLGKFTVEYFDEQHKTKYMHFSTIEAAKAYASELITAHTLRNTTLEDVFYNFTNRKVK
ncbi:ABC transporter ATP-binding protein [Brassicibacter mesophilus]|uniref:ABC transporter ATP-binding protein n=1 Tax=Brassicibacter mesophilus TaxID=745119 RepID=UPI003D1B6868